jgi:hypothetical protein
MVILDKVPTVECRKRHDYLDRIVDPLSPGARVFTETESHCSLCYAENIPRLGLGVCAHTQRTETLMEKHQTKKQLAFPKAVFAGSLTFRTH